MSRSSWISPSRMPVLQSIIRVNSSWSKFMFSPRFPASSWIALRGIALFPAHINPGLIFLGNAVIQEQRQIQKRADGGKSPPHRKDGSSGPPAPYQYPAHRSMRRSDKPKVVSSAICKPPFHGMKKSQLVNWLGGSDLPSWFYI